MDRGMLLLSQIVGFDSENIQIKDLEKTEDWIN
jgi:hypothetical protein